METVLITTYIVGVVWLTLTLLLMDPIKKRKG